MYVMKRENKKEETLGVRSDRHGHPVVTREVAGSSPAAPAILKGERWPSG